MHMADAFLSPIVGGTMMAAAVGTASYSIKKVQKNLEDKTVPLMGVMGAFVFAAQMINFTIPGTGSSGHIAGGLLLAILLGPYAGFLTMTSILIIQALFFADGGLLALGANVFNLGFYSCFIAYPFIFRFITKRGYSKKKIFIASMISSIVALQLGALSVVIETFFSGKTELPFTTFLLWMQPIHLAIGVIEGLVTAGVVVFVWKARPELVEKSSGLKVRTSFTRRKVIIIITTAALFTGGVLSWFASSNPDGLEWSIIKTAGTPEIKAEGTLYEKISAVQRKISFLPDYSFKFSNSEGLDNDKSQSEETTNTVNAASSVSGLIGVILTLGITAGIGAVLVLIKRNSKEKNR